MSAVLKQSLSCAAQLFKPTFYKNVHDKVINNVRTELKNNSIRPIIWVMCIVGTVGYTMEYAIIGKFHVAERQAAINKALASIHH